MFFSRKHTRKHANTSRKDEMVKENQSLREEISQLKALSLQKAEFIRYLEERSNKVYPAYSYNSGVVHGYMRVLERVRTGQFDWEQDTNNGLSLQQAVFVIEETLDTFMVRELLSEQERKIANQFFPMFLEFCANKGLIQIYDSKQIEALINQCK